MNLDVLLFLALQLSVIGNGAVTLILVRAAWHKPRYWSLTLMATSSALVTIGLGTYIWAVLNAAAGYIVDQTTMRVVFRAVLIGLSAFPFLFVWVYATRRFRDGHE
jgi:uncharacterized YccA/Bax inhibitor family protein